MFSRLNQVVRANLGALLDRAEDPGAVIAQTVRELENGLKQAQAELVQTLGNSKRLSAEADTQAAEGKRWAERAALAVRSGDDTLAKDALKQKLTADRKAAELRQASERQESAAEQMRAQIDRLQHKTEELKNGQATLAAQVRSARAAGSHGAPAGGSALDDLERLVGRIDQMEAEIDASSVLSDVKRAELERRFSQLEARGDEQEVEDELSALKRKVEGS